MGLRELLEKITAHLPCLQWIKWHSLGTISIVWLVSSQTPYFEMHFYLMNFLSLNVGAMDFNLNCVPFTYQKYFWAQVYILIICML